MKARRFGSLLMLFAVVCISCGAAAAQSRNIDKWERRELRADRHEDLLTVRQHRKERLPGDACKGVSERQSGAVLGRCEARRKTTRDEDRQEPAVVEGQLWCGPW